jgi:AraC-like DNA-binding protein
MKYYTIAAPASLAQYVRFFWVLEGEVKPGDSYIHRTMASGCPEIFFHYNNTFDEITESGEIERSVTAGLGGPSQKFNRYIINKSFGMFGAYLYPYAIPRFFNMPATELTNQLPGMETLAGNEGKELEEKIMMAENNLQRTKILTAFLEKRLCKNQEQQKEIMSAVNFIIQNNGAVNIAALSGQCYLSTRQFERKFKECSGFSPKLFSRITRFQSALSEYGNKNKSLTHIAYDCGYYDQSHFIHDFKEFSGYQPGDYFAGHAEGIEWREA